MVCLRQESGGEHHDDRNCKQQHTDELLYNQFRVKGIIRPSSWLTRAKPNLVQGQSHTLHKVEVSVREHQNETQRPVASDPSVVPPP